MERWRDKEDFTSWLCNELDMALDNLIDRCESLFYGHASQGTAEAVAIRLAGRGVCAMKVRVHVRGWEGDGKVSMFEFTDGIKAVHDGGTLLLVRYLEESAAYEVVGRFAAGAWLYYENARDTDRAVEHLTARSPEDIL